MFQDQASLCGGQLCECAHPVCTATRPLLLIKIMGARYFQSQACTCLDASPVIAGWHWQCWCRSLLACGAYGPCYTAPTMTGPWTTWTTSCSPWTTSSPRAPRSSCPARSPTTLLRCVTLCLPCTTHKLPTTHGVTRHHLSLVVLEGCTVGGESRCNTWVRVVL